MKYQVTFETKCWEKDYKLMSETDHLSRMIKNCNFEFNRKNLFINNVDDENVVLSKTDRLKKDSVIDNVFIVNDFVDDALKEFEISKDSLGKGYYYSVAELVSIYLCETKYLLHFSSDSYLPNKYKDSNWIKESIDIMEKNPDIIVANPTWNYKFNEAKSESIEKYNDDYYISQGFSDQCYLINVEEFKNKIYNYKHPKSERYPKYGGGLFEKRVDAFMRCNKKYRLVSNKVSYVSKNITAIQIFLERIGLKKI